MTTVQLKPWDTVLFEVADAWALQQLGRGEATDEQQKRALKFIIDTLCRAGRTPYYEDPRGGSDGTNVLIGRLFVGNQILRLVNTNIEVLKQEVHARKGETDGRS